MPGRKLGTRADINVRFLTEKDYVRVRRAAARASVSLNLFISAAALHVAEDKSITKNLFPAPA